MELLNKKVLFLGDSITQGVGVSAPQNRYTDVFARLSGAEIFNYGISGTRIARQLSSTENSPSFDRNFVDRSLEMNDEADIIVVFGGTNDYGHGDAEFGRMGDRSEYTFYGAFYTLAEYLIDKYGREKVCFILPIPRYNQNCPLGSPERQSMERFAGTEIHLFGEYVEAEREILSSLSVNYLDFSDIFPEPKEAGASELFVDGLHPNDVGHRLIAERIVNYVLAEGK